MRWARGALTTIRTVRPKPANRNLTHERSAATPNATSLVAIGSSQSRQPPHALIKLETIPTITRHQPVRKPAPAKPRRRFAPLMP
jgi:hypothetical protein